MKKAEIRIKYKNLRNLLTKDDIDIMSDKIAENILKLEIWNKTYFHVFKTIETLNEVDTRPIIEMLQSKNKPIIVSKSDFKTIEMTHFLVNKDTVFVKNKFNISEPYNAELIDIEKIDVVFIPLLAFDNKGNRVGYGKGFYDRFLHKCKPDCIFIGVSFFEAENEIDGIALEDFKLNFCVLPTQIISFINQKMI